MIPNTRIVDASLLVLHKHQHNRDRPIRALVDADFDRIRAAKQKIAAAWYGRKAEKTVNYHTMRGEMLDAWAKEHKWHVTTRNLYASILSKLTVWERHSGISKADRLLLDTLRPGANLFLQFLTQHHPALL